MFILNKVSSFEQLKKGKMRMRFRLEFVPQFDGVGEERTVVCNSVWSWSTETRGIKTPQPGVHRGVGHRCIWEIVTLISNLIDVRP